jgi:hypothetical protein
MMTCKMHQAVQTRNGRTEPVCLGAGEEIRAKFYYGRSKNHPPANQAEYTNIFMARSSARKATINTCHAAPDSLFPHDVTLSRKITVPVTPGHRMRFANSTVQVP